MLLTHAALLISSAMMDGMEHSDRINVKTNILQNQCEVQGTDKDADTDKDGTDTDTDYCRVIGITGRYSHAINFCRNCGYRRI